MPRISDMQYAAAQFGASNRVIVDDTGMGGFYVAIPKMTNAQLIVGGDNVAHPAFIVDGEEKSEILIAKYPAFVKNNRAYSLPGVDPTVSVKFDQALEYCRNKGKGYHLITNAERAMLALWCRTNNTMPRGNTHYGYSSDCPSEIGIPVSTKSGATKTSSGYSSWYHNGDLSGISDLGGNVWDWCAGLRLMNGKIQIIPNNDAALDTVDVGAASTQWKEILATDGSLVEPGTTGTVGYAGDYDAAPFTSIATTPAATGNGAILLEKLGLIPHAESTATDYGNDAVWANSNGEALALRGGSFYPGAGAGVFALTLNTPRSYMGIDVSFRAAFIS